MKSFPFEYKIHSKVEVQNLYNSVVSNVGEYIRYSSKTQTLIIADKFKQSECNKIIDYFVEDIRLKGKRYNSLMSAEEYYKTAFKKKRVGRNSDIRRLKRAFYSDYYRNANGYILQSMMFITPLYIFSSTMFSPSEHSKINILDMCGGWGDRLLAAIGSKRCRLYHAVDTNRRLVKKYKAIAAVLITQNQNKNISRDKYIKLTPCPFETLTPRELLREIPSTIKNRYYDLMFSSPPYYIAEKYNADSRGEVSEKYKPKNSSTAASVNAWLKNFMYRSLDIVSAVINPKTGTVILMMEDIEIGGSQIKYVDRIISYMKKKHKFKFTLYHVRPPSKYNKKTENVLVFRRR